MKRSRRGKRTESRIEHIQRHLVALLCPRDRDKSFVAVILRFVDFDDTAAEVSDLVDLRTTLANDSSYHIIWYEDLLCQWLTR